MGSHNPACKAGAAKHSAIPATHKSATPCVRHAVNHDARLAEALGEFTATRPYAGDGGGSITAGGFRIVAAAAKVRQHLPMAEGRQRALLARHHGYDVRTRPSLLWHWATRWWRAPRAVDPVALPRPVPGQVAIAFGGHSSALLRYHNIDIACDPMLATWHRGIHREVAPGLTTSQLASIRLVLISGADPLHLHTPTLRALPPTITAIVPPGAARRLAGLGLSRVIELGDGAEFAEGRVTVHAAQVPRADMPYTNAYVVRGSGPTVAVCGDGAYGDVFARLGEQFEPDIALLPISGFRPLALRANHMSPLDALEAFHDLRARLLIPVRHSAFALSYESFDAPLRWLRALVAEDELAPHVRVLAPGEVELFAAPGAEVQPTAREATARYGVASP